MDNSIYLFIGGLGLFFFGMNLMSEALKRIAGERLKKILSMVTRYPFIGLLAGTMITCLIQSSSATTVMVVGFVNAGLLTLKQAISVVMGANIGTTFTAWLVSSMSVFKITKYAIPLVGVGFAITQFAKTRRRKAWGEVLIGFGLLFMGLDFLKDAVAPLKDSAQVKNIFVMFSQNPLLGILVGVIFTVLLQSSSATIAIVQVLALNGLITFEAAIPLILGDNIGTTITAQLAALKTNLTARRAAMSHTLFNVLGVSYMLVFVYLGWYSRAVEAIIPGALTAKNVMLHIAVAHSLFNVTNALVFLPFTGFLETLSCRLVPRPKGAVDLGPQYLEKHLLETPSLAMEQARNETIYMLGVSGKAAAQAVDGFMNNNMTAVEKVWSYERATDNLQSEITQYLIDLSARELSEEESQQLPVLIHNVNDIERIGDHAANIAEMTHNKIDNKAVFSAPALEELNALSREVMEMFRETQSVLKTSDQKHARDILKREDRVNELHNRCKQAHVERLNNGTCRLSANFIFLDYIDNMEKIADHLTNIVQGVLEKMQWKQYAQDKEDREVPSVS